MRILLLALLMLTSCISTKKLLRPHNDKSTQTFDRSINGVYENIDVSPDQSNSSLLNVLYEKRNTKFPDDWNNLQVHISFEDEKVYVRGMAADTMVYESEIWGGLHEEKFTSNRKFLIIPLLLFNLQRESRIVMFMDEGGDLHATHRGYYWWMLAFGANGTGDSQVYERFGQFRRVGDLPSPFGG